MRIAIFSDLHDNLGALLRVERDAQQRQADRLIFLGDAGHTPTLFAALHARDIAGLFGNWEVSGLARLPAPLRDWVAAWPATLRLGDVLCCHATPDLPAQVTTTADAVAYMGRGILWSELFPRLHTQEEARWQAWAALGEAGLVAAFYGHTHIQQVWRYADARWSSFAGPAEFVLPHAADPTKPAAHTCHLIGVGSAGAPQDGSALRYALYDDVRRVVNLLALAPGDY